MPLNNSPFQMCVILFNQGAMPFEEYLMIKSAKSALRFANQDAR